MKIEIDNKEYDLPLIDESGEGEGLYLQSGEHGPESIIAADSWHDAHDAWLDQAETVPANEVYEAYGFETDEGFQGALSATYDNLELVEGFSHQPNATGTGIVFEGYSFRLDNIGKATA